MHIRPVSQRRQRAVRTLAAVGIAAFLTAFAPAVAHGPQAGVAFAAGVGNCTPDAAWPANQQDFADRVVALVNQHRAAIGLGQLRVSPTLTASAVWKARHMAYYSYMQHDDPAPPVARTWFQRVQACGYPGSGAGENIAYGYTTPDAVMSGWLASPGHKANLENASYTVIGVGVAGTTTTFWAQDFGSTDDSGSGSAPPPPPGTDTTAPSAPGLLTATSPSSTQVNLTWGVSTDNVGVSGYRVYRGGVQVGAATGTSYTDAGLTAGTAYTYTVKAYDAAGNVGAASNQATVTTRASTATSPTSYASSVKIQNGSFASGSLSSLRAKDASTLNVASSSAGVAWYARFPVSAPLSTLSVTYAGNTTSGCTRTVGVWDNATAAWRTIDTRSEWSVTSVATLPVAGTVGTLVSGGQVLVRVACTNSGTPFTLRSDQLTVSAG